MPTGMPHDPYQPPPEQFHFFACHNPLFVYCATCGATPGVYCLRPGGGKVHDGLLKAMMRVRIPDFHSARAAIVGLGYCPTCSVPPGSFCVTSKGTATQPHRTREPWRIQVELRQRIHPPYWPGRLSLDHRPGEMRGTIRSVVAGQLRRLAALLDNR